MSYFEDTLTVTEAKQRYRQLARQYHPDILKDDGATMVAINTEYAAFTLRSECPVIGVAAPAPGAPPMAWFAAMKAAAQAAAAAAPDDLRRSAQQAQAHAAQTIAGTPPPHSPAPARPPRAARTTAAAAPSPTATPTTTPSSGTTTPPPRRTRTPVAPSGGPSLAQREEDDYDRARNTPRDPKGHRRSGDVVIFWEDTTFDCLECVAILTASHPRHEIRRNGAVIHTEPATRRWQAERKDIIERARRMI